MPETPPPGQPLAVHRDHRRSLADHLYIYAVVSRRSQGVSIGINLNPDKICNFDCVYCQVDRTAPPSVRRVDEERLCQELEHTLDLVCSGELFEQERFRTTPVSLRRLNDIAFSGDGEPTTYPRFLEVVQAVAEIKRRRQLNEVKIVLISNATMFHRPRVQQALALLDTCQGEIWAKLEAGTEAYYQAVERSSIPFARILENIASAARLRPIVIQALFMRLRGEPPSQAEKEAFCDRLKEVLHSGGQIRLVQVYTVARAPAETWITPLSQDEVEALADLVRQRTGLPVQAY